MTSYRETTPTFVSAVISSKEDKPKLTKHLLAVRLGTQRRRKAKPKLGQDPESQEAKGKGTGGQRWGLLGESGAELLLITTEGIQGKCGNANDWMSRRGQTGTPTCTAGPERIT